MRFVTVLVLFFAAVPAFAQSEDPARQFDFWIGEWDVNLRVQQPDKSWKDQHKAKAHIYSILGGKAILELWSEEKEGINGYSLRYYNPEKKKWDLWLNWAGKNRSGTNGLEGEFRHGRGEFFGETKLPDGNTRISRFTFSDISKNSLRWDDAFSTDGGKTWASNWIMEFTRKADKAPEIGSEQNLLTYFDGSRCDLPEFEFLKAMSAKWEQNEFLSLHEILDGCILIGFWSTVQEKRLFFTLTWNTYAGMYELAVLDNEPRNNLTMYYGSRSENQILLKDSRGYKASISTNADGEFVGINIGTPSGGSGFQVEAKKRP